MKRGQYRRNQAWDSLGEYRLRRKRTVKEVLNFLQKREVERSETGELNIGEGLEEWRDEHVDQMGGYKKVKSFRIIGQVLISRFRSLEPAGPVKDGVLDTWLVHRSACCYLCNLQQQSPLFTNYYKFHRPIKGW